MSVAWTNKSSTGFTARAETVSAVVNGQVYLIFGCSKLTDDYHSAGAINVNEMYDPSTDTWTSKSVSGISWIGRAAGDQIGGVIYVTGGDNGSGTAVAQILAYDTASNSWSVKSASGMVAREWHAAGAISGVLVVYGGWIGNAVTTSTQAYNPVSNTWSNLANGHANANMGFAVMSGALYVVGGGVLSFYNYYDYYTYATNTWTYLQFTGLSSMLHPSLLSISDGFLITGGTTTLVTGNDAPSSQNNAVYPLLQSTVQAVPTTSFAAVGWAASAVVNNVAYVFGGATSSTTVTNTVQSLDLSSLVFMVNPTFVQKTTTGFTARDYLQAVPVNGLIYALFGQATPGSQIPAAVNEMYDPNTDTWTSKSVSGVTAVTAFTADQINGIIYVAGGTNGGVTGQAQCAAYDPASNSWSQKSVVGFTARWSTQGGAYGGVLFVFAGTTVAGGLSNTFEGYDASTNTWSSYSLTNAHPVDDAAACMDDSLYVVGGIDGSGLEGFVQNYDPLSNTWTQLPAIPKAVIKAHVAYYNSYLYVFSGNQTSSWGSPTINPIIQVYDFSRSAWWLLPAYPMTPVAAGALANVNSTIYIMGGAINATTNSNLNQSWGYLPATPVLLSPTNGSSPSSVDVNLSWTTASLAAGYDYEVATDPNFANIVDSGSTANTSVSVHLSAATYYWRVQATNSAGSSSWSTVWSFTPYIFQGIPHCDFYVYPENMYLAQDEAEVFRTEGVEMIYAPDEREVFQA